MENDGGVPFLTRKHLSFENGTAFSLSITMNGPAGGTVAIRGFTKEGPFNLKIPIVSTGVSQTNTFRIPDIPTMISVVDNAGNLKQGMLFAELRLVVNETASYALCSGWVYKNKSISYPAIQSAESIPDRGEFAEMAPGSAPAAGAQISFPLIAGYAYRITDFVVDLTTNATVANRRASFGFTAFGNDHYIMPSLIDQLASTHYYYYGGIKNATAALVGTAIHIEIPQELWVKNTDTFFSTVVNMQAGDQWGICTLVVERFITS